MKKSTNFLFAMVITVVLGTLVHASELVQSHSIGNASSLDRMVVGRVNKIDGYSNALEIHSDHLFAAIDARLVIFDISDPSNPTQIGQSGTYTDTIEGLAISNDYAYVAFNDYADNEDDGLAIIDVSTLSAPSQVGLCDTPGEAWGVAVSGDHAFVADGSQGLQVCDVSPPADSIVVGSYTNMVGFAYGVIVSGTTVYVGAEDLYILNATDPASPGSSGSTPPPRSWHYPPGTREIPAPPL